MKTAEEVAQAFIDSWPEMGPSARWFRLAQILTAFADERVKEAVSGRVTEIRVKDSDLYAAGRAEALEEAAKIADGRKFYDSEGFLASAIRALKAK